MNVSQTETFLDDKITVTTKTKVLFMTKPQSGVIPFLLNGRMTAERGFLVFYSITDEEILQELHEALCSQVRYGSYEAMKERVMRHQSPFLDEFEHLTQYVTGFKY